MPTTAPAIFGVPFDVVPFALTLAGVGGLVAHHGHAWVIVSKLFALLVGFAVRVVVSGWNPEPLKRARPATRAALSPAVPSATVNP